MFRFAIRVKPRARSDRAGGAWGNDDALVVEVGAPADDGKANRAVVAVVAEAFAVRRHQVRIVRGETSRSKLVAISDPPADAAARLQQLLTR